MAGGIPMATEIGSEHPKKPDVSPDRFTELDLRVGRVVAVDAFPEARTAAWKLTVDFGSDLGLLQTSAQVMNYQRDELLSRLVIGVVNLGTRRIASLESQFLVLAAVEPDDTVRLLEVPPDTAVGAPIS
jgi:tRNA-binding protein